jgi:hypothetical protein
MRLKRFLAAVAALILPAGGSAQSPVRVAAAAQASPVDWSAAAAEDVEAAYAAFAAHHPGMFDPNNPGFPDRLRRARDAALAFADRVSDAEGHMRALALFSAGLADGHAQVFAAYSGTGGIWPGFTTVWRGDALHVLDPSEDGPPRDAVLVACDGRAANDVIRELAFAFYGRPDEAGQWWVGAPGLFDRPRSSYESLPRQCSFRTRDGAMLTHALSWRPVPRALFRARLEAARREPIGLTEPRPGLYRIVLSSFTPDYEGRTAYARLFENLERRRDLLAASRAIILDLRGNGGGSSSWSVEIAERLWGAEAVTAAQAAYFRDTRIRWFADQANIDHLRINAERIRSEGRAVDARELEQTAEHLAVALGRGQRFFVEDFGPALARQAPSARPRHLPPVYVITDGNCASACLDAIDLFTRFPGVKLVGAPTSADSNYLDIRRESLPSGRGWLVMPMKIWVGRPRASGEVYRPAILVNDLEWRTDVFLDHIERDLAR